MTRIEAGAPATVVTAAVAQVVASAEHEPVPLLVAAVLVPSVAMTKLDSLAVSLGVKVAVAVPLAPVIPDDGEMLPVPVPPSDHEIGTPASLPELSETVTVTE